MMDTDTSNGKQSRITKVVGMLLVVMLLFSFQAPAAKAGWKIKPDWSRVQAVTPGKWTTVLLYQDLAPRGERKIKGRFHSATAESITILLGFPGQGQTRKVEKSEVRRVLVFRPVGERYQGFIGSGIGAALTLLVAPRMETRRAIFASAGLIMGVSTAIGFLVAPKKSGIYNVPRNYQKRQKGGSQSAPNRKDS